MKREKVTITYYLDKPYLDRGNLIRRSYIGYDDDHIANFIATTKRILKEEGVEVLEHKCDYDFADAS